MKAAIFDSTVWIDFLNGRQTDEVDLLSKYLDKKYSINLCPIIVQEILQGIRNDSDYHRVRNDLFALDLLVLDSYEAALGTAELFRNLKKAGISIRKSTDCLIAYYALHFNLPLVHNDKDFDLIASKTKLKIVKQ